MRLKSIFLAAVLGLALGGNADAQSASVPAVQNSDAGTMLLTVFLRHDQSKTLKEINETLWKNGYFDQFPPAGTEVVSWYVVMGIGQVITLKFPAEKLRAVNVALENTAWGPYRTDFYPTYDYQQLAEQQKKAMQARPK
jgi:hypothetical protein